MSAILKRESMYEKRIVTGIKEYMKPKPKVSIQVFPVEFFDSDVCKLNNTVKIKNPKTNETREVKQEALKVFTREYNGEKYFTYFV